MKKIVVENGLEYEVSKHKNGTKYWYLDGKLHRINGPAVIYSDGTVEYWVNGKYKS